jgi:hypothetical protein
VKAPPLLPPPPTPPHPPVHRDTEPLLLHSAKELKTLSEAEREVIPPPPPLSDVFQIFHEGLYIITKPFQVIPAIYMVCEVCGGGGKKGGSDLVCVCVWKGGLCAL